MALPNGKNKEQEQSGWNLYSYTVGADDDHVPQAQIKPKHILEGFAETSTMHGFPRAYSSKGFLKKAFWTIITLGLSAYCLYNVAGVIMNYLSWGVSVNVQFASVREVLFPAVTICNLNPYRLSRTPAHILSIIGSSQVNSSPSQKGPHRLGRSNRPTGLGTERSQSLDKIDIISEELTKVSPPQRETYGYQLSDMILTCNYQGFDCSSPFVWTTVYNWKNGNCFTFNAQVNSSMARLESHFPGPDNGLQIVLNIEQSEYLESSQSAGARVILHDSTEMPFPEEAGIDVTPGLSTSIGMRRLDLARLGGLYGNCRDSSQDYSYLNIFEEIFPWTNYSVKACQKTCWQSMVMSACGCYDAKFPPKGAAFGDLNPDTPCLSTNKTHQDCLGDVKDQYLSDESCTYCYETCNQTLYEPVISTSLWPSKAYLKSFLDGLTHPSSSIQQMKNQTVDPYENLLQVNIYYEELNYEIISEKPTYDISSFMADLGGAIGLWVGASVMSLFEFVELIIDLLVLGVAKLCFTERIATSKVNILPTM